MAAKVLKTLAEPGMMQKCLDSIASGQKQLKHVLDWAKVVRNYGKTQHQQEPTICFFDMEGQYHSQGDKTPPYSATIA